jgi:hypothetical protein
MIILLNNTTGAVSFAPVVAAQQHRATITVFRR